MDKLPLKTILVIEDDHDTRVSLRQQLEAAGYYVFSAADGRQGLELLRRIKPPCLVLLDLVMPLMDGQEFIKAMDADHTLHLIPVVVVTAFPDKAKTVVATAFVHKPLDLNTLLNTVQKYSTQP